MSLNIYGQSFFVTKKNDTILIETFSILKGKFEYNLINSKKILKSTLIKLRVFTVIKTMRFMKTKKNLQNLL